MQNDEATKTFSARIPKIRDLRDLFMILKKERYRGGLEILKTVKITAIESRVEFTTADLNTFKIFSAPAIVDAEGSVCVDLIGLEKVIAKIYKKGGDLALTGETTEHTESKTTGYGANKKTQKVKVKSYACLFEHKALSFRFMGNAPEEFPAIPEIPEPHDGYQFLDADRLTGALESCMRAASKDEMRKSLCGVYLTNDLAVATDGHRMRKIKIGGAAEFGDVIVRREAVSVLLYAAAKIKPAEIAYQRCGSNIIFGIGRHRIVTRPIEGTFPDFTQVLPNPKDGAKFVCDRKALLENLKTVSVLASSKSSNVRLTVYDGEAELYASDASLGEGKTTMHGTTSNLPADVDGVKAGFNHSYLEDVLKDLSADEIEISLIDSLTPCTIREPDGEPEDLWVVMPMRL